MAPDHTRVGGGTPAYEANLERKRQALRQALRGQYLRQLYNPRATGGLVFDTAFTRWQALQNTRSAYHLPSMKTFGIFLCLSVLPITLSTVLISRSMRREDYKFRHGLVAYDDPERHYKYYL